ncbi:MAG TPA: anti-sigma factor [Bryobacteraceae bacterium]|nr:anti-sigma factor [Bryobacteraceae bacterium]
MNCAEAELYICDLVDGTLAPEAKAELERHMAACSACAELARDAAAGVSFMERAAEVEPPPELVTRILFDPPWAQSRARAAAGGLRNRLRALWQPILQPRFAMGMAMTILSFAMLARFVKPVRQLTPGDLNPKAVWAAVDDRAYRTWQRTVKFYESLRLVYQIQSTVREWQQEQEAVEDPAELKTDERRLPVGGAPANHAEPTGVAK